MEFEVSVRNIFEADSAEDAVLQMAAWLSDYAYQIGYRVENENMSLFIDAEDINHGNL